MTKLLLKISILFISIISVIVATILYSHLKINKESEFINNQCNIEFKGIVISKRKINLHQGAICVKVITTNMKKEGEYNIDNSKIICKYHDGKIIFFSNGMKHIKAGDSIVYNPFNCKRVITYRDGKHYGHCNISVLQKKDYLLDTCFLNYPELTSHKSTY